jgi:hypothetical protein
VNLKDIVVNLKDIVVNLKDIVANLKDILVNLKDIVIAGHCQRPATTRPTTLHVCKTRGCQCSFRLQMMGGVSPETC